MSSQRMQGTNRPGDGPMSAGAYSKLDREYQTSPLYALREALIQASRPNNTEKGLVKLIQSGKQEDIVLKIQAAAQHPKYAPDVLRMFPKGVYRAIMDYTPKSDS